MSPCSSCPFVLYFFFLHEGVLPVCLATDLMSVSSLVGHFKSLCQRHVFAQYQYVYLTLTCLHLFISYNGSIVLEYSDVFIFLTNLHTVTKL